jgi:hypothetical protein
LPSKPRGNTARNHEESFAAPALEEIPVETATPFGAAEVVFEASGKTVSPGCGPSGRSGPEVTYQPESVGSTTGGSI